MRRLVKIAATLGAGAMLGAAATGIAVATATTVASPTILCVSTKTHIVSVPVSGSCGAAKTALSVASAADVAGLAARLDQAESALAALEGLNAGTLGFNAGLLYVDHFQYVAHGTHLKPGTDVRVSNSTQTHTVLYPVGSDGVVDAGDVVTCEQLPLTATGTDVLGNPVTATLSSVTDC